MATFRVHVAPTRTPTDVDADRWRSRLDRPPSPPAV